VGAVKTDVDNKNIFGLLISIGFITISIGIKFIVIPEI
jgi:hypothetical protein